MCAMNYFIELIIADNASRSVQLDTLPSVDKDMYVLIQIATLDSVCCDYLLH